MHRIAAAFAYIHYVAHGLRLQKLSECLEDIASKKGQISETLDTARPSFQSIDTVGTMQPLQSLARLFRALELEAGWHVSQQGCTFTSRSRPFKNHAAAHPLPHPEGTDHVQPFHDRQRGVWMDIRRKPLDGTDSRTTDEPRRPRRVVERPSRIVERPKRIVAKPQPTGRTKMPGESGQEKQPSKQGLTDLQKSVLDVIWGSSEWRMIKKDKPEMWELLQEAKDKAREAAPPDEEPKTFDSILEQLNVGQFQETLANQRLIRGMRRAQEEEDELEWALETQAGREEEIHKIAATRPVQRLGKTFQTLPPPNTKKVTNHVMTNVKLVRWTQDPDKCPEAEDFGNLPEVAFIGRSNVGKSSLLNMLTLQRASAKVSKIPGTTREINHYLINQRWFLVDLPGYGYAKATPEEIAKWTNFTKVYFTTRSNLASVFLLVDASIPPQAIDMEYADWLIEHNVPFAIVFTKMDYHKKNMSAPEDNQKAFETQLMERWNRLPTTIASSARTMDGRKAVLKLLSSIIIDRRKQLKTEKKFRRMLKVAQKGLEDKLDRMYSDDGYDSDDDYDENNAQFGQRAVGGKFDGDEEYSRRWQGSAARNRDYSDDEQDDGYSPPPQRGAPMEFQEGHLDVARRSYDTDSDEDDEYMQPRQRASARRYDSDDYHDEEYSQRGQRVSARRGHDSDVAFDDNFSQRRQRVADDGFSQRRQRVVARELQGGGRGGTAVHRRYDSDDDYESDY